MSRTHRSHRRGCCGDLLFGVYEKWFERWVAFSDKTMNGRGRTQFKWMRKKSRRAKAKDALRNGRDPERDRRGDMWDWW